MKNRFSNMLLAAFTLLAALSAACKKEDLGGLRQTTINTSFELQLAEKILVTSPDRQLAVELRSLNDNRCTGFPCEHAGNATARVFISDAVHHVEAETNLCIGMCNSANKLSDTVLITMDQVNYSLILRNVSGSPDRKAELQINRN